MSTFKFSIVSLVVKKLMILKKWKKARAECALGNDFWSAIFDFV